MSALPDPLRAALDARLARFPQPGLARAVEKLSTRYRDGSMADSPVLTTDIDVAAYAGYRMPATYAALRAVLAEVAERAPGFAPRTHVDVGGGTGSAVWAAAATWPSLEKITVVERADAVLALGRQLAQAGQPPVSTTTWTRAAIDTGAASPAADLVTLSYVLGELPATTHAATIDWLAAAATTVVVVEAGTPAGYRRVITARDRLIELGMTIAAPCPHAAPCPMPPNDWCHFSARLPRTSTHRQLKGADLGWEDEKYAYVVATTAPATPAPSRVLRHPMTRKKMITLELCAPHGMRDEVITKSRENYRAARDAAWGDAWEITPR